MKFVINLNISTRHAKVSHAQCWPCCSLTVSLVLRVALQGILLSRTLQEATAKLVENGEVDDPMVLLLQVLIARSSNILRVATSNFVF